MANGNEISSTEKLLGVIRRSRDVTQAEKLPETGRSPHKRPKLTETFRLGPLKHSCVGVDISYNDLKFVRIKKNSSSEFVLDNFLQLTFPQNVSRENPAFAGFLRHAFETFGAAKKERIWCSMSSAEVDVGHIKIPRVNRNQIANAVYFTVRKENPFDEDIFFLDFEVQAEVMESGTPRFRVLYYLAPRKKVDEIKALFAEAGINLTGVSIGPFANQNFFRTNWVPAGQEPSGSLYIGRDWSRIDIFSGGNLMLTRGIKAGINSLVESLKETYVPSGSTPRRESVIEPMEISFEDSAGATDSLKESSEGSFSLDEDSISVLDTEDTEVPPPAPGILQDSFSTEQARKIVFSLGDEYPQLKPGESGYELSAENKLNLIEPAAERLVRQVERTFEYYATTLGFGRVKKIFVSGGIEGYRGLVDYIGTELGIEGDFIDPLDPGNPGVDEALPPDSLRERMSYTLAAGLSLSDDSRTPNLIRPYEAKDRAARIKKFNKLIFVFFLLLMAAFGGYNLWQKSIETRRQAVVTELESRLAGQDKSVDREEILAMLATVNEKKSNINDLSSRYLAVAVFSEVASSTPEAIRLLSVRFVAPAAGKEEKQAESAVKFLSVEGLVFGGPKRFDSILAGYLVKLESSPIFANPRVEKTEVQKYRETEVLRFTLKLEVF